MSENKSFPIVVCVQVSLASSFRAWQGSSGLCALQLPVSITNDLPRHQLCYLVLACMFAIEWIILSFIYFGVRSHCTHITTQASLLPCAHVYVIFCQESILLILPARHTLIQVSALCCFSTKPSSSEFLLVPLLSKPRQKAVCYGGIKMIWGVLWPKSNLGSPIY